jgi:hypothetical protein
MEKVHRRIPTVVAAFLAALACALFLAPARADAKAAVFRGVPPLVTQSVTTTSGNGEVTLRMMVNPQVLTVTSSRCSGPTTTIVIRPNDHTTKVLLAPILPGTCFIVRITGAPIMVTGLLSY